MAGSRQRQAFLQRDLRRVEGKFKGYADKFALLVACSYHGQSGELMGCARDLCDLTSIQRGHA